MSIWLVLIKFTGIELKGNTYKDLDTYFSTSPTLNSSEIIEDLASCLMIFFAAELLWKHPCELIDVCQDEYVKYLARSQINAHILMSFSSGEMNKWSASLHQLDTRGAQPQAIDLIHPSLHRPLVMMLREEKISSSPSSSSSWICNALSNIALTSKYGSEVSILLFSKASCFLREIGRAHV